MYFFFSLVNAAIIWITILWDGVSVRIISMTGLCFLIFNILTRCSSVTEFAFFDSAIIVVSKSKESISDILLGTAVIHCLMISSEMAPSLNALFLSKTIFSISSFEYGENNIVI